MKLKLQKRCIFIILTTNLLILYPQLLICQESPLSDIYCTAYSGCTIFINSITINDLNNSGTICSPNGFGNYTPQIANLSISQDFNIVVNATGSSANSICKIWIDWNQDADFSDDGEAFILNGSPGPGPYSATITVPADAYTGNTRIRIRVGQNNVNPCGYIAQGETEDYTASIHNLLYIDSISQNIICSGDSLKAYCNNALTFEAGNHFILQLSNATGSFDNPINIGDVAGIIPGVVPGIIPINTTFGNAYRVRVHSTNPISNSNSNSNDITIYNTPDLHCNNPLNFCIESIANLTSVFTDLNNVVGEVSYWTDAQCSVAVQDPTTITESGTYYIKKVAAQGGCTNITHAQLVFSPGPQVEAGTDTTISFGDGTLMNATINGGIEPFTFSWDPTEGLDNPNILQPMAYPIITTVYHLLVTDQIGCYGADSSTINVQYTGSGTLNGIVQYDNLYQSPLNNINVELKYGDLTILSTTTNSFGEYEFTNVPAGNFSIVCNSSQAWGGGNAVDALKIMKHFTGMQLLEGLRLLATDVDISGNSNSVDALLVMKRFVSLIDGFASGDWFFEQAEVSIYSGIITQQNIKGICFGDVDGSYNPIP